MGERHLLQVRPGRARLFYPLPEAAVIQLELGFIPAQEDPGWTQAEMEQALYSAICSHVEMQVPQGFQHLIG